MKQPSWSAVLVSLAFSGILVPAHADVAACGCYCGKVLPPPCSDEACKQACGWQAPASPSASPSPDDDAGRHRQEAVQQQRMEADRQREQDAEALRMRQEEEARRRQADFEHNKRDVLKGMKGVSEGEPVLKGGTAGDFGLKGTTGTEAGGLGLKEEPVPLALARAKKPVCEWGDMDAQVVDLRCLGLDPDKPVVPDPHVAKGRKRVLPAQIDPRTFENANYAKGFAALERLDVASAEAAVRYFRAAQQERPGDPMVRNGLLLAQDILKARQGQRGKRERAAQLMLLSYAALMAGDDAPAKLYSAQARKLAPKDNSAKFIESLASSNLRHEGASPDRKYAYRLVANSLVFIKRGDIGAAAACLESARYAQPQDTFIDAMSSELRNYGAKRTPPASGK